MHRSNAVFRGRELVQRLRTLIPRQMYEVSIQAAIGANIIARENVKALRKNVLAKCYGGDISRFWKLTKSSKQWKEMTVSMLTKSDYFYIQTRTQSGMEARTHLRP